MSAPVDDSRHWLEPPEWWKKVKPLRWAAIFGILFVVGSMVYTAKMVIAPGVHPEKERFTDVAADPVVFLDKLSSYEALDTVRAQLDQAQVKYTVTSVRPPASAKYPPRDRDTLVANAYAHLGVEGQLTLEFFNNRLYEADFVPSEIAEYAEKLHKADPRLKKDRLGRAERIVGNLRVASNVDFAATDVGKNLQTKPYVIWQDLRLTGELDEWDRRFVALPSPH